jgi:hypothetical protein
MSESAADEGAQGDVDEVARGEVIGTVRQFSDDFVDRELSRVLLKEQRQHGLLDSLLRVPRVLGVLTPHQSSTGPAVQ